MHRMFENSSIVCFSMQWCYKYVHEHNADELKHV